MFKFNLKKIKWHHILLFLGMIFLFFMMSDLALARAGGGHSFSGGGHSSGGHNDYVSAWIYLLLVNFLTWVFHYIFQVPESTAKAMARITVILLMVALYVILRVKRKKRINQDELPNKLRQTDVYNPNSKRKPPYGSSDDYGTSGSYSKSDPSGILGRYGDSKPPYGSSDDYGTSGSYSKSDPSGILGRYGDSKPPYDSSKNGNRSEKNPDDSYDPYNRQ